ncbi:DUF903 domain-containing protein [Algoriphagus sp. CAU 1675]|uniref:DUF903 domain-containing protein n=1 Tax=Algoriphagus sp. CAU 1675 TaxID=3032597 RepID=UPI0023DC9B9B|nr:DUF903 domain-containing protein [Algoriphagus sp. CAU 1675]MDF2157517.1 DUF903 domain-containing protein [Algoriphagus sp. CAU 1675]
MKKLTVIFVLLALGACKIIDDIVDIERIDGPCTILLTDGSTIVTNESLELSVRTQAITYRDDDGKLWSLFKGEYQSYTCGN